MTDIVSPLPGTVVPLDKVPDPVFAAHSLGEGAAIIPDDIDKELTVAAPVSGKAIRIMPHAFLILSEQGKGVLVHVGIDTVSLHGDGFTVHVEQGSQIEAGQAVLSFNPATIAARGFNPICPVIIMHTNPGDVTDIASDRIETGEKLFCFAR